MTKTSDLYAALTRRFAAGEWFLAAEAVLVCGALWNSERIGALRAAGLLDHRAVPLRDPRRSAGSKYEYRITPPAPAPETSG